MSHELRIPHFVHQQYLLVIIFSIIMEVCSKIQEKTWQTPAEITVRIRSTTPPTEDLHIDCYFFTIRFFFRCFLNIFKRLAITSLCSNPVFPRWFINLEKRGPKKSWIFSIESFPFHSRLSRSPGAASPIASLRLLCPQRRALALALEWGWESYGEVGRMSLVGLEVC